ncbi:MAG: nuclear transport factor 2 family protein [Acidimicrobiia bacterium]|nr:nuclear transport factor 2 family protein [Acidimicrobiia bacterium]
MTCELDLVERYFKAFNAHDLEAVVDCFTDDGVITTSDGVRHHGAREIRRFYDDIIEQFPDARCELQRAWDSAGTAAAEWDFTGTRRDQQDRFQLVGAELFTLRDAKIDDLRVYDAKPRA